MLADRFAAFTLKDFEIQEEIFRSKYGGVFKAKFNYNNRAYVLKERRIAELGRTKDMLNEVKLLDQLNHPNVIKCEGHFWDQDRSSLYLVLEYCECGDLQSKIDRRKRSGTYFDEAYIWKIFYQICAGVRHLHEHGIVHRDIKTSNVMMSREFTIAKVGDLGVSRQISDDTMMLETMYGTPLYLSPELVDNQPYNDKTDVWSLGVLLYEFCALRSPFCAKSMSALCQAIKSGVTEPLPHQYSNTMKGFVQWLLQVDQKRRPNVAQ
eukprot:gene10772-22497_t